MIDKTLKEEKKLKDLGSEVKRASEDFRNPATSNFARDSLMTITTRNYREYLRLVVEYQIPTRELRSVTESYLGMLNEWITREEKLKMC